MSNRPQNRQNQPAPQAKTLPVPPADQTELLPEAIRQDEGDAPLPELREITKQDLLGADFDPQTGTYSLKGEHGTALLPITDPKVRVLHEEIVTDRAVEDVLAKMAASAPAPAETAAATDSPFAEETWLNVTQSTLYVLLRDPESGPRAWQPSPPVYGMGRGDNRITLTREERVHNTNLVPTSDRKESDPFTSGMLIREDEALRSEKEFSDDDLKQALRDNAAGTPGFEDLLGQMSNELLLARLKAVAEGGAGTVTHVNLINAVWKDRYDKSGPQQNVREHDNKNYKPRTIGTL